MVRYADEFAVVVGSSFLHEDRLPVGSRHLLDGDNATAQVFPHRATRARRRLHPRDGGDCGPIEIASGVGLLIPPIAGLAAPAAASVLIGAVAMEAFVLIDGNPIVPAVLVVLLAVVAWHHRARTMTLLTRALTHARTRNPG